MRRGGDVDVLVRPSVREVRAAIARSRPMLFEGLIDNWPALQRWSPEYFRETIPGVRVPVEVWTDESVTAESFVYRSFDGEMSVAEYVDLISSQTSPAKTHYMAQVPIFRLAPQLAGDIVDPIEYMGLPKRMPARLLRMLRLPAGLWFGPAGTVNALHMDWYQNLFVQIRGRKRFFLYSPDDSANVYYPQTSFGVSLHWSPVDAENPDLEKYPRFKDARRYEVIVEGGQVLYIPAGWWHHVRALSLSVSLNFWWWDRRALFGRLPFHADYLLMVASEALKRRVARRREASPP